MAGKLTISTLNDSSGVLATQNGMTGICKAWISYNSTVPTINGAFNVSSVTINGTGDYTFNFTTAMPSVNYSAVSQVLSSYVFQSGISCPNSWIYSKATGSVSGRFGQYTGTTNTLNANSWSDVYVAVFSS